MSTIARSLIGLTLAASLFWPTAAAAQKSSSDFRRNTELTRPRRFSFKTIPAARPDSTTGTTDDSAFVDESTNIAIAEELERRGWTRSDDKPEVYVITHRTFHKKYTAYGPFWGPYYQSAGWWGPYPYPYYSQPGEGWAMWDRGGAVYTEETVRGTLTVDLQNAVTGALLWRGVGTRDAHDHSTTSRQAKHVNHEVEQIFERFPAAR